MKNQKTNHHVYVVEEKDWSWGHYDSKRDYFYLGWCIASENELEENGVSHTRNSYYYENSGVTFRVIASSQKEAVKKVRRYIRDKKYSVFNGLDCGTNFVSLRLR